MTPQLTIVIGATGAGKSSWCDANRDLLPQHFYDIDWIARGLGSVDEPATREQARQIISKQIEEHLQKRRDFGFESSYTEEPGPKALQEAWSRRYGVRAIFVGTTNSSINTRRIALRAAKHTGRNVSEDQVEREWTGSGDNLIKDASRIYSIKLFDNSQKMRRVAVLEERDGCEKSKPMPQWAELMIGKMRDRGGWE